MGESSLRPGHWPGAPHRCTRARICASAGRVIQGARSRPPSYRSLSLPPFFPSLPSREQSCRNKLTELGVYYYGNALEKRGQKRSKSWFPSARGCGGYGRRCGQTEAATEQLIAAPAWPSYGTRPPLRNLCVLRTVRAAGSGFRGRHRALCAGRGILGRLFGLSRATAHLAVCHRPVRGQRTHDQK